MGTCVCGLLGGLGGFLLFPITVSQSVSFENNISLFFPQVQNFTLRTEVGHEFSSYKL